MSVLGRKRAFTHSVLSFLGLLTIQNLENKGNVGDSWENYLEGRERMDLITKAQPQWTNLNILDSGRLDEFFDHTTKIFLTNS